MVLLFSRILRGKVVLNPNKDSRFKEISGNKNTWVLQQMSLKVILLMHISAYCACQWHFHKKNCIWMTRKLNYLHNWEKGIWYKFVVFWNSWPVWKPRILRLKVRVSLIRAGNSSYTKVPHPEKDLFNRTLQFNHLKCVTLEFRNSASVQTIFAGELRHRLL